MTAAISPARRPPARIPARSRTAPLWHAFATVWREPRATFDQVVRGDAAGLVILVAWLAGVLDVLQTAALRGSLKPHWGPFALLMAVFMGPLLGFLYFDVAGSATANVGRLLGGTGDVSETRVALACGTIVELAALPIWALVIAFRGPELFTTERPPASTALLVFAALQALLWAWSWLLRIVLLAEAHEFSIGRALATVLLSWLVVAVLFVGLLVGLLSLVGK